MSFTDPSPCSTLCSNYPNSAFHQAWNLQKLSQFLYGTFQLMHCHKIEKKQNLLLCSDFTNTLREECKEKGFIGSLFITSPFVSLEGHRSSNKAFKAFTLNVFQDHQHLGNFDIHSTENFGNHPEGMCLNIPTHYHYCQKGELSWNLVANQEKRIKTSFTAFAAK